MAGAAPAVAGGEETAAVPRGGVGATADGAAAPPFSQSRICASSSGARPANRICAEGPPRTTRPQLWNAPQVSRTVSPALSGNSAADSTPADDTVA